MGIEPAGNIDLHIHTTASDGTFTPSEIIQMALARGLGAIAITDHDTLAGSRAALAMQPPDHLNILSGVEISTAAPEGFPMAGSLHILGYGVDLDDEPLEQALVDLQHGRDERIPKIVTKLNRAGIPVSIADVMAMVVEGSAGRPHVAQALIRAGVARDVNDAFDRFLAKGQPGYVEKRRIDCRQAIALIRGAGGIAVLAHPYLAPGGQSAALADLLATLCDMGLQGIEAYYSRHSPQNVALYLEMARRFDLVVTGGSDFHGDLIPDILLGNGEGDLSIPYSVYEALLTRIAKQKAA
ncbi:PHP domain-containing protein [Desulfatitalea tepidiphila]|uniref:PHP domain-containing protein n=1 Tax=Desulfatitalea tepidiphila TaxID=1185843 RepID=UPI0006B5021F|nr:PHP domain-containing protein [Desulfatitalea tepidiphila]